jgi:hypothetical protein
MTAAAKLSAARRAARRRERERAGLRVPHIEIDENGLPAALIRLGYLSAGAEWDARRVDAAITAFLADLARHA